MNKRVLIVSQVIPQWYVDLLTASLGKDVTIDIITASEVKGNIIKSPKHNPASLKSRLVSWYNHYSFMCRWIKKNQKTKYDLIFAVSNPPINPFVGLKIKKKFNAPFIYMNWDLYPQVIRASIHNPIASIACTAWSAWNNKHYTCIDQIITIGNIMASSMNAELKNKASVKVIPIGVDTKRLKPIEKKENKFCVENGLSDKFVVLYSGKMGLGHNIEMILEAAGKVKQYKDIVFVFIGFGPKYVIIEQHIKNSRSDNIMLLPLQSEEMFPYSMACGDIGVVSQEASMAHLFMPSKVYSMMACGEAIIGIGTDKDDLSQLIKKDAIGISIVNGSADSLAESIVALYKDKETLRKYKNASRKAAEEKYDLSVIQKSYSQLFRDYLQ